MSITQITLTAGHSMTDPGSTSGSFTEASIVTDFRNMVKLYIERDSDIKVITDGEGLDNEPLGTAIKLAQKSKLSIEFHLNAFNLPTARGVEALSNPKFKGLCQALCRCVAGHLNTVVRGTEGGWKAENSGAHSRLGYISSGGGIVFELFYVTNSLELNNYNATKWLIARDVAAIIIEYCKNN